MIVFKKIVLKNDRFYKRAFFEMIVFYKTRRFVNDEPSLKIINDDPSLTIVNEERKRNKKRSFNDCFQKRLTTLIVIPALKNPFLQCKRSVYTAHLMCLMY